MRVFQAVVTHRMLDVAGVVSREDYEEVARDERGGRGGRGKGGYDRRQQR